MATTIFALVPYKARPIPYGYDAGWLGLELANIQRAIPSGTVRTFIATSTAFTDRPGATDHVVLYDATAHAITVQLPRPEQCERLALTCKRISGGANTVTLVGTIDGVSGVTLAAQYDSLTIVSSGNGWYVIASL